MKKLTSIYLSKRFYWSLLIIATIFIVGHFVSFAFVIAKLLLLCFAGLVLVDLFILLNGKIEGQRELAKRFSNGDPNPVVCKITNKYSIPIYITLIEELPHQFQKRDFSEQFHIKNGESIEHKYLLKPVERGIYSFGYLLVFTQTILGILQRKFKTSSPEEVSVYPSFYQLKKLELIALSPIQNITGHKKLQRLGNNKEFEQIKEYVSGDDYRKINWKATARFDKLMVNEYQDERSQHVYQLVDMGRTMKMPFEGMSLMDYAINSSLALANVILKKHDKTGLLTYSSKLHSFIKSDNKQVQLTKILETLYAQQTRFDESNLESVYTTLSRKTTGRSLLIFYTNFESVYGLERQLPLLKRLADQHLVLLVSFINTELVDLANKPANNTEEVYQKVLAETNILDKQVFMDKLIRYGIMNLRVKPDELTISVLNKYLEIKKRGMI